MTHTQLSANEPGAPQARKPRRKAVDKPQRKAASTSEKLASKPEKPVNSARKSGNSAQKPQRSANEPVKAAACMYIGPNVGKGQLAQYTIFRGELPRHVQLLIEQTKELETLIVPVALSAKAIQKMNMPGTVEYRAAQKVRG